MIPANQISSSPVPSNFIYPYNLPVSPGSQMVPGGINLSDASKGRLYQNWSIWYDGININVAKSADLNTVLLAVTVQNVLQCSLAFDNNMAPVIGYMTPSGAFLRYYDTQTLTYKTIAFPTATSCLVCVDNSQPFYNANSDVVFAYTDGAKLYFAYQRDVYGTIRVAGNTIKKLLRFGPSTGNRLQFELTP